MPRIFLLLLIWHHCKSCWAWKFAISDQYFSVAIFNLKIKLNTWSFILIQSNPIYTLASYNRLQAPIILQECTEGKRVFSVWIIHVYESLKMTQTLYIFTWLTVMVYEVNNTSSDSSISAEEFQYYILQQDCNFHPNSE